MHALDRMAPILDIEDEQDSRIMLATILRRLGYQTLTARDGLDGLTRARQSPPAVVLLDLHMPYLDGAGFRAEQKADPELADMIPKPIDVDRLTATVEKYAGPAPHPL